MPVMPKILVSFEPAQLKWLRKEARQLRVPVSELLRRLVGAHVPKVEAEAVPVPLDPTKPTYETLLRGKGLYDECATLPEMLTRHSAMVQLLNNFVKDGVQLGEPIHDDYAFLYTQDPKVAKRHSMDRQEAEE